MIGMGADGLEEANAIDGIVPGAGEHGAGLIGATTTNSRSAA